MARKVRGHVRDVNTNEPIQGARVLAFDADSPDADDFMGESATDTDGYYEIQYAAKSCASG